MRYIIGIPLFRPPYTTQVLDCCFNATGNRLASASADATARVYNVMTGACLAVLVGHEGEISKISFSPSGHRIITAASDRACRVWNVSDGECLQILEGHTDEVGQQQQLLFS